MIKINCRTDFERFFEESLKWYDEGCSFPHQPFIVMDDRKETVEIVFVDTMKKLLNEYGEFPNVKVMKQWMGKWKSDFIQFTIAELQLVLKNKTT